FKQHTPITINFTTTISGLTMSTLTTNDLHQIFKSLDQNDDGFLSLDELKWLLERIGLQTDTNELTALIGKDGLSFDEFCNFYEFVLKTHNDAKCIGQIGNNVEKHNEEESDDLYKAFKVFDLNGDGLISSQELQSVLWKLGMWDNNGGLDCDRIMRKYDVNCDGFVDFDEFKRMMLAH
ncbi:putative calcium-binding protein CML44, partial [Silene latifolia]|uniref:putative calcium-binding protein CML44 n=1 Tax=Silene latifolia TaxID=37657 RepID=UPI003D77B2F2